MHKKWYQDSSDASSSVFRTEFLLFLSYTTHVAMMEEKHLFQLLVGSQDQRMANVPGRNYLVRTWPWEPVSHIKATTVKLIGVPGAEHRYIALWSPKGRVSLSLGQALCLFSSKVGERQTSQDYQSQGTAHLRLDHRCWVRNEDLTSAFTELLFSGFY